MAHRVALAEDKPFLARAVREKVELFPDELTFAFHAGNGRELLEMLAERPDVDAVLMDIEMPVLDGIEATAELVQRFPDVKVIMLTVFDDDQRIFQAIRAGATGYLLKDEPPRALRDAVLEIMAGGAPMSPTIAAKSLALLRNPARAEAAAAAAEYALSKRETEVLEHLGRGLEYREIAETLFISPATVRKHIENIYRKLQVDNKMRAVRKASRHGLI